MLSKGVYLCARLDRYNDIGFDIDYNDIDPKYRCGLTCDCQDIDLARYDFIIATPPCNYYSKANYRRDSSKVALLTKHLLPYCLEYCTFLQKPFIIENVNNVNLLPKKFDKYCYRFTFGGHTFWTNVYFDYSDLIPVKQFKADVTRSKRDGNYNVHCIINRFLETLEAGNYLMLKWGYYDYE